MTNRFFLLVISLVSLSYGGINYYIGSHGWLALGSRVPFLPAKVYWAVFWLVALSYLAGRVGEIFAPGSWSARLVLVGAHWLGAMFYFFLALLAIDLVGWLDRRLGFLPGWVHGNPAVSLAIGLVVLALVSGLVIYGSWNARHPRVRHYDVTIRKPAGELKELRAVLVSDIHLGTIIGKDRLREMVEMVKGLDPDIVLLPGDIIDERVRPFAQERMGEIFRELRPKYGVFAVLGNHEYIGGQSEQAVRHLEEAGIRVLRDEWVKVADGFYLVGRENTARGRFAGERNPSSAPTGVEEQLGGRVLAEEPGPLSAIMAGVDRRLPIILMDHEPDRLGEAQAEGVDLQLSGHTHVGQLYPNNLITRRIYEVDWRLLRKGDFQVVVSSGFGTWGPPMRVGNKPELLHLMIRFEP